MRVWIGPGRVRGGWGGRPVLAGLALAVLLAGCGAAAPDAAQPGVATPEVQKLYDSSCRACHSLAASGAPQTGDRKAWAPRLAQGEDALLDHAINGYKRMPPMGLCQQCSEDEFIALIDYMTGRAPK